MYNLKWFERLIITGVIFVLSVMASIATKSDMWITVTLGCAVYQVIDQVIYNLRFNNKN